MKEDELRGYAARMGEVRNAYSTWGDLGVDGKVVLEWILRK
jgi:hypothetical protein